MKEKKQKPLQLGKSKKLEQRHSTRGQGQPQPEQTRRRILGGHLRQALPDSRE
jgi:hypothetical protein